MHLHFAVINQTLYYKQGPPVVADSQGYLVAAFKFTGDWEDTVKYAQFIRNDKVYSVALDGIDQCIVPWEVLAGEGAFYVNVFATNRGNKANKFITANSVKILVKKSGLPTSADPAEPTEGIFGGVVSDGIKEINDKKNESLIYIADQTEASLNNITAQEESSLDALSTALLNAQAALNAIKEEVELLKTHAANSAQAANTSALNADTSDKNAAASAKEAKNSETASKGYAETAQQEAENASLSEQTASQKAVDAQNYANESKKNADKTQTLYDTFSNDVTNLTEEVHANTNARAGITVTVNNDGSLTLHKPD